MKNVDKIERRRDAPHYGCADTRTWAGFEGSHTVSDALFVTGAEADPVTEGGDDVAVAERHHLQHPLDLGLQVSQQLL